MLLYPMIVLSDCILWQVIDMCGREHWSRMIATETDPMPLAMSALPGKQITKCAADDEAVIKALDTCSM